MLHTYAVYAADGNLDSSFTRATETFAFIAKIFPGLQVAQYTDMCVHRPTDGQCTRTANEASAARVQACVGILSCITFGTVQGPASQVSGRARFLSKKKNTPEKFLSRGYKREGKARGPSLRKLSPVRISGHKIKVKDGGSVRGRASIQYYTNTEYIQSSRSCLHNTTMNILSKAIVFTRRRKQFLAQKFTHTHTRLKTLFDSMCCAQR